MVGSPIAVGRDPPQFRPEQEVRYALVLFGGVSLAVYINGVVQEFFRLVRSTAPEWPLPTDVGKHVAWFPNSAGARGEVEPLKGSERVYRRLGELLPATTGGSSDGTIRTRFVVDILSGTSAGGINGIFLAKAIANQQSIDSLRDLWVKEGDIGELLNDARSYEDIGVKPQRPPRSLLNGYRLYVRALEALRGMAGTEEQRRTTTSPSYAEQLDLAVTTTDLQGLQLPIKLFDGVVHEARHKHVFRFAYWTKEAVGAKRNDFGPGNDPMLAFAARCTSSFPFAFEPMVLDDLGDVLPSSQYPPQGEPWRMFFSDHARVGADYAKFAFADGGYLDNKPFSHATEQLTRRRADVPVDRRLIYIEPDPGGLVGDGPPEVEPRPEVFENVAAAVTTLPRAETIREDIDAVVVRSRAIARIRDVTGQVINSVASDAVRNQSASIPPPKGPAYVQLRRRIVLDDLAEVIARVAGIPEDSDAQYALRVVAGAWATQSGIAAEDLFARFDLGFRLRRLVFLQHRINELVRGKGPAANLGDELALWTITPETRSRLLQLKMALNEIFVELRWRGRGVKQPERTAGQLGLPGAPGDPATADEEAERFRAVAAAVEATGLTPATLVENVLDPAGGQPASADTAQERAGQLATARLTELSVLADALRDVFDLPFRAADAAARHALGEALPEDVEVKAEARRWLRREHPDAEAQGGEAPAEAGDADAAAEADLVQGLDEIPAELRRLLEWYYNAFEQIDALLLPLTYPDLGEVNPVEIIRISPQDAKSLIDETNPNEKRRKLAGTSVHHFGGFFDRDFRVNDIFWGRLDGAERIIETTLPPSHPAKNVLLEAAQLAIIHEDLLDKPEREPWVTAALGTTPPAGRAPEASFDDLRAILGADWTNERLEQARALRRHLDSKYEVDRRPERRSMLDVTGRATLITSEVVGAAAESVKGVRKPMFWLGRVGQLLAGLAALATAPRQGELPRIVFRNIAVIAFLVGLALVGLGILGLGGAQKSGWILIAITIVAQVAVWAATAWVGAPDRAPGRVWPRLWRLFVRAAIAAVVAVIVVATVIGFAEIVELFTE